MRNRVAIAVLGLAGIAAVAGGPQQQEPVTIRVDTAARKGLMYPFWAWSGHDEPNYTYTANGRKLLSSLQDLSPVPGVRARAQPAHVGRRQARPQMGFDERLRRGCQWQAGLRLDDPRPDRGHLHVRARMKPFVQLGFMPEALSSAPAGTPYRHFWKPGNPYNDIYTGWTYTPKDYKKWEELCYQVTKHLIEKYGRQEVESWWFELWNEPDIGYWSGSVGRSEGRGDPRAAGESPDAARRVQQALRLHG